jgi:hypothetical protein
VLNEGSSFFIPESVEVFRTLADMCATLEPWYVEEKCGYALTGSGVPIELTTDGISVSCKVLDDEKPETDVLTCWLAHSANSLREARLYKSKRRGLFFVNRPTLGSAEQEGLLPHSIEGLLAYISLT